MALSNLITAIVALYLVMLVLHNQRVLGASPKDAFNKLKRKTSTRKLTAGIKKLASKPGIARAFRSAQKIGDSAVRKSQNVIKALMA